MLEGPRAVRSVLGGPGGYERVPGQCLMVWEVPADCVGSSRSVLGVLGSRGGGAVWGSQVIAGVLEGPDGCMRVPDQCRGVLGGPWGCVEVAGQYRGGAPESQWLCGSPRSVAGGMLGVPESCVGVPGQGRGVLEGPRLYGGSLVSAGGTVGGFRGAVWRSQVSARKSRGLCEGARSVQGGVGRPSHSPWDIRSVQDGYWEVLRGCAGVLGYHISAGDVLRQNHLHLNHPSPAFV